MVILALDTSTSIGSIALDREEAGIKTVCGDPTLTHGERLPADILALVSREDLTLADIDRFAVAIGPGSFTGLRVGIATMQALSLVHGQNISTIPTLAAVAKSTRSDGNSTRRILVLMDAQRGEVFAGLYANDGFSLIQEPTVGSPADAIDSLIESLNEEAIEVVGNGVPCARFALKERLGSNYHIGKDVPPLAPTIARMAAEEACETIPPHAVRPLYIRKPAAVLARQRFVPAMDTGPSK